MNKEEKEMNKKGMVLAKSLFETAELQLAMINKFMGEMKKDGVNAKKKKD